MTKVLVTGGCGYIGSHVVKALTEAKFEVLVLDNLSTGFADALLYGEPLIVGDVGDRQLLDQIFADHQIAAVLHFAASIVVPESVSAPLKYYQNNTCNLVNLLTAATAAQVNRLIFSSTASVYGNGDGHNPFREHDAPAPESPYGTSKLFSEQIIRDTSNATALKHVILRYFNVAGADPEGRIGQRSPNATHLIKTACEAAVGKRQGLTIFGDDYPTPDGTCIRDYIHVSDLADAHVLALQHLLAAGDNLTLNCAYGRGYSVKEVVAAINHVLHEPLAVQTGPRRPGDAIQVMAIPDAINSTLGWQPRFADLTTIVEHAYQWERQLLTK